MKLFHELKAQQRTDELAVVAGSSRQAPLVVKQLLSSSSFLSSEVQSQN